MSANVDAMVREGINAYRAGNKDEARTLLYKAVEIDEQHEQAWLWLSAVVDSIEDQQTCLENVLTINPNNERARDGLRILNQRAGSDQPVISSPSPTAPKKQTQVFDQDDDDDAFANLSFTDQAAPPPAKAAANDNPFSAPVEEELPTSVDWAAPPATSSSSSFQQVKEPTPADYDDWVAGLNLNTAGEEFDDDDDVFDPSPFMVNSEIDDIFNVDADEDESLPTFDDIDDRLANATGPFDTSTDYEDPFMSPDDMPARSSSPAKSSMMSPAAANTSSLLEGIESDEFDDLDDFGMDEFDDNLNAIDPSEYFKSIPAEIAATRMPGTSERAPVLLILGVLLLLGLNIGAVFLVVTTLTTA